jgi:hypothetical protein
MPPQVVAAPSEPSMLKSGWLRETDMMRCPYGRIAERNEPAGMAGPRGKSVIGGLTKR